MSDSEATPTIRRSGRDRKQAKPFVHDPSAPSRKRKRGTDDEGGDTTDKNASEGEDLDEHHDQDPDDADDADAEDYSAPKRKNTRQKKQPALPGAPKGKGKISTAKKSRPAKTKAVTGPRKDKADASIDVVKQLKDSHISDDNPLFNAILNPSAALQSTVEDYLDSLSQSPSLALADLINCVIRACGCNGSVDSDQAVDSDGVVEVLDTFTEGLKNENAPPYPLISKLPVFKKFHKQLSEFIHRLITSSAEMGSLYTSDLMPTLQSWVVAMSSSQLRSFRHTATAIAMLLESALCEVAAEIEKEVVVVARQREGEKKRAGKSKGKGLEKELEGKAAEVRERKDKVGEYLREYFDGVFVHRYRDHDPGIRAECVQAMGLWLKRHPAQFLEGSYLRYVGWVLSDSDQHVRLEAVKSLHSLYAKSDYISVIQHFTDRFKGRLVQMATSDLELPVRVAVIQVLVAIDSHSLLEEAQRDELCLLIYDEEPRVRKAVAGFVRGVWTEAVEERMMGRKGAHDKVKIGIKCLAALLVQWGKRAKVDQDQVAEEEEEESPSPVEESKNKEIARLVSAHHTGRIALAVGALWDEVDAISDWEALLEHLLLDHTASVEDSLNGIGPSPVAARRRQHAAAKKKPVEEEIVDEAWRLTETEEVALLEVFVAALTKVKNESSGGKKGEEDSISSDITRALMKGLPRLFAKHQTDSNRVADVLVIPQLMDVGMYLEMRMIPAYESLWGDVTKQFLSHSSPVVLGHAMATIQHFMSATLLSNTNSSKIVELEEELSTSLRDAVAGREELEVTSFSEDEVHALGAIASRLVVLSRVRDMTSWMEEDEGGKQSSAWDIISALADRGRLGYKEEEPMIDECLRLLMIHLAWRARGLSLDAEPSEDEIRYRDTLREQRESLLEKITEYAVGTHSSACEGVKRAAFHNLLDLHILFSESQNMHSDGVRLPPATMPLTMSDETQYRCAGFVQAEIEQYVEDLDEDTGGEKGDTTEDGSSEQESPGEEDEGADKKAKTKKTKAKRRVRENSPDPHTLPRSRLEHEYTLNALLTSFIRAIRVGAVHSGHGAVILAHYGRLGSGFDISIKVVIDFLRDLGMYKGQGQAVSEIIVKALEEAFTLFLDDLVHFDDFTIALARALSTCFVVRGAQLSVVKRLENEHVVEVHTRSISWIVNRIAKYESSKNSKMCTKAVLFFRALQQLLVTVDSRDALKIKAHLHQAIAQAKLDVNGTKAWEPYRAYEKRLSTAMSKDKNLPSSGKVGRGRKSKKAAKSADHIHSDDEAVEVEGLISGSGTEGDEPAPPPRPKPRPKPRPAYRQASASGDDGDGAADVFGPVSSPKIPSPAKRRSGRNIKAGQGEDMSASHDDSEVPPEDDDIETSQVGRQIIANGHQPPQTSPKKRRREDSEPEDSPAQENDDPSLGADRAPSPTQSNISISDIKNRRKRVRR